MSFSPDQSAHHTVDFPPLANALDYLQTGVSHLGIYPNPTARDLKYAVLHLHAGNEVLLKYRLICHDWRLVLTDDYAGTTEAQYQAGDFRSIGADKSIERLREHLDIRLTGGQRKAALALARFRNQLQHHGLTSTAAAVEAQATRVLGFALDFIDQHLPAEVHVLEEDEKLLGDMLDDIRRGLGLITALVEQRMQRLQPALAGQPPTWCPDCGQPAVLLSSSDAYPHPVNVPAHTAPRCAFCTRRWDSLAEYVDDFTGVRLGLSLQSVADGGDPPTEDCPDCGESMLVWFDPATGERRHGAAGRCFACGCEFNDRCARCGRPVDNPAIKTETKICGDCAQEFARD